MRARGITPSCSLLWERGATALIGISPFNSYFDEDRIRRLLAFCGQGGREVQLFVPDEVTRHTLEAKGYAPHRAVQKAKRQIQYLQNKIARAANGSALVVLGCAELTTRPAYVRSHAELRRRFETEELFRQACLDTTRWVLAASPEETVDARAALLGVHYLLAELPLFLQAPAVTDRSDVVFVYHQCPRLVADLYSGRYGDVVATGQGFVEVTDE